MFFGGMPGFDEMPGGHPGMGRRPPREPANTTELYEVLEVEKTATAAQIKKSYRKLALQKHPDKGGDPDEFKKLQAAYEVLKDPEKREKYDQYGLEGLEDEMGGDAEDIFGALFGGRRRRRQGPRKGAPRKHPLKVTLEDLYNGKHIKLKLRRDKIVGEPRACAACQGRGVIIQVRQMGPMLQQVQQQCRECGATGFKMQKEQEQHVVDVHVQSGMMNEEKIRFPGMSDEEPNAEPGDVVIFLQEKPHPTFKRKNADLLYQKNLTLAEALCGYEFLITHLDGRQLLVKSKPGEVVCPETMNGDPFVKVIEGEGMPKRGSPFDKGNLFIYFRVIFPQPAEIDDASRTAIREALPAVEAAEYSAEEVEEYTTEEANMRLFGKQDGGDQSAYDSDEEGQQRVQCQQG